MQPNHIIRTALKRAVVALAIRGLLPMGFADRLLGRQGIRHA